MKSFIKFLFLEISIFLFMGLITVLEINKINILESVISYIKTPASWFIGLSLAFIFSYFLQNMIISFFRKNIDEENKKNDFFIGFIIATIITSIITPYVRELILYFFDNFLPYFHIILMESILIFYLLFKLKGKYEISGRYFLTNQIIVLFYIAIILYFVF